METTVLQLPTARAWFRRATAIRRWGNGSPADGGGFTSRQRLALLLGFTLLVMLRLPQAWLHGRFLDEEGTIFFAYAWHRPVAAALFRSFAGYLNSGANAPTVLAARMIRAGILPLEVAPYLTMVIALIVQTIPALLIVTGGSRGLGQRWAIVASLLVVAICPMTEEVFANVLHIQFHLALAAALILALDLPGSRAGRIGYPAVLFFAPLCGPGAIVLLPFFILRTVVERQRGRLIQSAIFALGTALQLFLFFGRSPVRGGSIDPVSLLAVLFVRLVALPFASEGPANGLGDAIHAWRLTGGGGWWFFAAAAVGYFALLIAWALRDRRDPAVWLIAPALALAAVSFGGGMIVVDAREWFSVGAGQRYNFLPLVLVTLGLIALAARPAGRYRHFCLVLVVLTLTSGAITYSKPLPELSQGPVWSNEVAAWRRNHDHPLAGWKADWTVDLSDRDRPCTPAALDRITTDPSYCESHWLARVAEAGRRASH